MINDLKRSLSHYPILKIKLFSLGRENVYVNIYIFFSSRIIFDDQNCGATDYEPSDFYSNVSPCLLNPETRPQRQCLGCFLIVHRNTRILRLKRGHYSASSSSETSLKARDADLRLSFRTPRALSIFVRPETRTMNRKTVSADRNSVVTSLSIKRLLYPLKLLTTRRT